MSKFIYTYNNQEYETSQAVRQAIWEQEHKIFQEVPAEKSEWPSFWSSLNVTYVEIPDPVPSLTEVKERKLDVLTQIFDGFVSTCGFNSSVGFKVDGNETSSRNVDLLIRYYPVGVETIEFCDFNNVVRNVTKTQLETIMQEIVLNAESLYRQKWDYRDTINNATVISDIENLAIEFECLDFSK